MADFGWAFVKGNLVTGSAPPSGAVQYNDGNNKFAASGDFTFVSGATSQLNLTGTLNVSGTINANQYNVNVTNQNVINLSATGSTKFGDSTDDTHVFTGSLNISAASNPIEVHGLQSGTGIDQNSYIALNSNYQLVLTSAAGGSGGTIGEAEDGTYTDGLFSDFTTNTPIGTAIDKFNEILKIIVPGPAPAVDRIDYTNTSGVATKLSFESQLQAPTDYVDVGSTGSFTSPPGIDDQYTVTTSGEDYRLGIYDGTQEITGVINFNVVEQLKSTEVNYSHDAFGNAESGSLNLYLNETLLRSLDLNGFTGAGNPNTGSASDLNASGSGFFDVSVSASATDQNGSTYDIFQHRTAKYVIDPDDQNKGWNYAKVEHQYGSTTYITNFVQWFNDTDASSQAMSVSNQRVGFTGNGSKYLSGVQYFRSASLVYNAEVANVYKFTYPTGNVLTFNESANLDPITAQSLPATDATDLFNKVLEITASTNTSDDTMLNDSTTISIDLTHPFKTNLSAQGSVTTTEILIYNVDTANSNTDENFDLEDYRLVNDTYSLQSDVTKASSAWDSENHMTSSGATGHTDGLLMYNGSLRSPLQGPKSGNFSGLSNGPSGNPDYSTVTGTRTFFRKIENTLAQSVRDLRITSTKSSRIDDETLTSNNIRFEVKIPESTGWMDISQNFSYGNTADDDGALISGASLNSQTAESATGDAVHCVTFGTQSVANGEHIVVRIKADESWTGNIDRLQFKLRATSDATDPTQAPALDDIDSSNGGNDNAKLSFGTSNPIAGFVSVEGDSTGSMADIDSNERYRLTGDRRGVFSSKPTLLGTLNQDVGSNGNNYPANSFFNAYTGSLVLEVNGTEVHEVSLTSSLNAVSNDFNGNSSGFSFSAVSFSETSDSIPDYTKPYRTGDYQIGTGDQNVGWNYARVIHRTSSDQVTNYVEWVVDTSSSVATSISSPTLTNFNHTDVYYQSGIGYFAANPSGTFDFSGSNFYNNVYQNGTAISFPTTTNLTINSITGSGTGLTTLTTTNSSMNMPALDNSSDCELTDVAVSSSVTYNAGTSISGGLGLFTERDVSLSGRIIHPLKTNRTTTTASKTAFMRYSGSIGSTNLNTEEHFGLETYRIVSGNYANQASVTDSGNTWDSTESVNLTAPDSVDQADGMVTVNGYAISPLKIGNAGDTRNVADGGSLQAPASNPNYSSLNEDIRTYYRYFRNETGQAKPTFTVTLTGDANLISKSGAFYTGTLGANKNITVELKVPFDPAFTGPDDTSTAWGDCIKPYSSGTQPDTDGVGIFNGGGSDLNQTVGSTGRAIAIQLQEKQIRDDQYFVIKISAHKDWTGYLSEIEITY
jgi:hypothetical protein